MKRVHGAIILAEVFPLADEISLLMKKFKRQACDEQFVRHCGVALLW
jgi:hypothetical protein